MKQATARQPGFDLPEQESIQPSLRSRDVPQPVPEIILPGVPIARKPTRQRTRKQAKPQVVFPPFPDERFHIIYADPPWDYKGQLQHTGAGGNDSGGALRHYPTVPLEQLCNLPIQQITEDNCLLFMWSSSPHLDQAIDLGKRWGFAWATVAFVWYKQRTNPGFYTMSQCELCLAFKRGKIPTPRGSRRERQFVNSDGAAEYSPDCLDGFVSELRGKHSQKPEEVRRRINEMFPEQSKIELFARKRDIPNWSVWGLEA